MSEPAGWQVMVPDWVEARLACPTCRERLHRTSADQFTCSLCGRTYLGKEDIPYLGSGEQVEADLDDHFERVATVYDEAIPYHVREHYLRKRIELIQRVTTPGTLLDVGCGTGVLAERLAEVGFQTVGLDSSPAMLNVLRSRRALPTVFGHSYHLPFLADSFDTVSCVATLHHVAEKQLVAESLHEMIRVAKPGGTVVVIDHNPLNPYWSWLMSRMPQDDGSERLVPLREIAAATQRSDVERLAAFRSGFVPDFMPTFLMPLASKMEHWLEAAPFVRELAAHNTLVVRKG
jgi:SAM-dependent methyltransferase